MFESNKVETFTNQHSFDLRKAVTCRQIHSSNIHIVNTEDKGKEIPDCDGLLTSTKNICLIIKSADCLPIYIYDPVKSVIGMIHSGWRGTQKGIAKEAIKSMIDEFASNPTDIKVYFGPAIDKENFLVRKDVYQFFADQFPEYMEYVSNDQRKLDLLGINEKQLVDSGLLPSNIKKSGISTFTDTNFNSYRRDGKAGNFLSGIMIK